MHYLSGGNAHMVYSQFVISMNAKFGEYAACNPNSSTGIFECEHYGGGNKSGIPKQCKTGFILYQSDCLNGTIYK